MITKEINNKKEEQIFNDLIEFNFKKKTKLDVARLIIQVQIQLIALYAITNAVVYVWQLITCPSC